jgi:hypothetical protein
MKYVRYNLPHGVIAFVPKQGRRDAQEDGGTAFELKKCIWELMRHMPLLQFSESDNERLPYFGYEEEYSFERKEREGKEKNA